MISNAPWRVTFSSITICGFYRDLDGEPAASLLAEARQRGVVTFLDEGFGYGPRRESLEAMLPHCDYVMPSFDDLQAIYPNSSAAELADRLIG